MGEQEARGDEWLTKAAGEKGRAVKPYFERNGVTLYHGDCRDVLPSLGGAPFVIVTDPPYGISHKTSRTKDCTWTNTRIAGDESTLLRDWILDWGTALPSIVFGSPKAPKPARTRGILIWDKGPHAGMGDLSFPWKPSYEEIYIMGIGFTGKRDEGVIKGKWIPSWEKDRRTHPHEKPVLLLKYLISKCPPGTILDPFAGSCSTLVAAYHLERRAIGIEIEERYCEISARRLEREMAQGDLFRKPA